MSKYMDGYWKDRMELLVSAAANIADYTNTTTSLQKTSIAAAPIVLISSNFNFGLVIQSQNFLRSFASGGSMTQNPNGNGIDLNIDATLFAISNLRSRRVLRFQLHSTYRIDFCGFFAPGAVNSLQLRGCGNDETSYNFINLSGLFGVARLNGQAPIAVLTITAGATINESVTVNLSGELYVIDLVSAAGAVDPLAYTAHQFEIGGTGGVVYGNWRLSHIDNRIYFFNIQGLTPMNGVYAFIPGAGTTAATCVQTRLQTPIDIEFIPQAFWSTTPPNFDFTERNDYSVMWSSTHVEFLIRDKTTLRDVVVYSFMNDISTLLPTPNFYITEAVASLGSVEPVTMTSYASCAVRYGGDSDVREPSVSVILQRTILASTTTVVGTFAMRKIVNNTIYHGEARLVSISASSSGTKPVNLFIHSNAEMGSNIPTDYTRYNYFDELESGIIYDSTAVTQTSGSLLKSFALGKEDAFNFTLDDVTIFITPSDTISISALSSNVSDVSITVTFIEYR